MAFRDIGCMIISNSDDLVFLRANLFQVTPLFRNIVISIGTSLWNGEPEDNAKIDTFINECTEKYSNVTVLKYDVPKDMISVVSRCVSPEMYWEGHARWVAYQELVNPKTSCSVAPEYVLFLDSDEVVDGEAFKSWLETGEYKKHVAMKLRNYWYWREPIYRAEEYFEDSVVLAKVGSFIPLHIFSNVGRHGVYDGSHGMQGTKARDVPGCDGLPMIHHYSWVRTKEQMLRKVRAWGHRNERKDWNAKVEEEFNGPFKGTDFLKKLKYKEVFNKFNIYM